MNHLRSLARAVALAPLAALACGCATAGTQAQVAAAPATAIAASPVSDSAVKADPAFEQRVTEIVAIMNGKGDIAQTFSPKFLAQVPAARLAKMTQSMREAYGAAESVSRVDLQTPYRGVVVIDLERSQLELQIGVDPTAPHQVGGLLIRQPGR